MTDRNELIERWLTILWFIGWGLAVIGIWFFPVYTAAWIILHAAAFGFIIIGFVSFFLWEWAIEPTIKYLRGEEDG